MYSCSGCISYHIDKSRFLLFLQVSMNGYATLGEDILPPNPPEGGTNMTTRVPIIAPWWMDMDTSSGPGGLYVDRYTLNDTSDPVVEMINADIDSYLTEQSVSIKFGLVATWNEVEPYPSYESGDIKEVKAIFLLSSLVCTVKT